MIHPGQIAPANHAFTPPEQVIAQAREMIAAFDLPENAGAGVINLAGRMVERLHLMQAQRLLAQHQAIGSRNCSARDIN